MHAQRSRNETAVLDFLGWGGVAERPGGPAMDTDVGTFKVDGIYKTCRQKSSFYDVFP